MAGFNLFNTNAATSTTQSAPFGVSSTPNTGNSFFGSSNPGFGTTQTPAQNLSFGGLSTTGNTQNVSFGGSTTAGISFGLPRTQSNSTFGTTPSNTTVGFGNTQTNPAFGTPSSQGGISFGTPSQPGMGFGASTSQPTATFGSSGALTAQPTATFGSSGAFTAQPAATFGSSGAPTAQPTVAFGSSAASTVQPNTAFGSSPASTTQPTVAFGSPATSTVQPGAAFGSSGASTTQPTVAFGSPAAATVQPGAAFGSSGASTTQPTAAFGSPGALPSFGSLKPQTPIGGSNLFATSNTNAPQTTALLGGNTPTTSNVNVVKPTFGGLNFAANTSTTQTGISFGQPSGSSQAASTTAQPSLFSMPTAGATSTAAATSAPTLSFGATTTSQPLSFGSGAASLTTNVSSTQPTGLGGLTFSSAATSAPSLSFGGLSTTSVSSSSTATTTGLLGSSFGATTTNAGSGVFSWQKPTTEVAATTATSIGLGGLDHTAVSTATSTANTVVSAKEQMLPNEIQQTVTSFKEYVKTQKNLSSEVARTSAEPLTKLTQQIGALNNLILTLGSILSQQKFTAEKIKLETIKSLNDYELAQKIKDSPVASEERMYAIRKYFIEKISSFEESTKTLQEKIEYVYQHVITLPQENSLSAEALKLIVKKLHDSFVVIGARAYKLHNDMQLLKVQYLTLRNHYVKDNSSISFSLNRELQLPFSDIRSKSNTAEFALEGPNPFSRTAGASFNSLLLTSQNRNFPPTTTPSKDWNVTSFNTTKPFGFSDVTSNVSFDQNSSLNLSGSQQFNLQKPPVGNKRGKR